MSRFWRMRPTAIIRLRRWISFQDGALIGIATTSPYSIVWTNPPGAVYSLTAIAKDANGGMAVSAPVFITVLPGVSGSNYVWTGSVSSDWFNPANWSPAGVPGAQDAATINGGSPTLTADVNLASLFLNGGNLYGSSSLFVGNALDWASGSIFCPVTVLTNAAMNWISSSTLYLYSAITNAGTINWYLGGNLQIYNYPPYSYTGGINNLAGGAFNVQCDANMNAGYGYEYFNNAGTFTKVQSTNLTRISTAFTNSGSVLAQNGTIYFAGGGSLGGSFQASTNANIDFGGGTFDVTGMTNSCGPVNISGGYVTGTLNTALNWTGGSISGGSSLTVASNGVLNINPGGTTRLNLYGVLTNYGTVNWLSGNIQIYNYPPYSYTGGINNMAEGAFNVDCDQTIYNWEGYEYFVNAGAFTKIQSTNTTTISVAFTNSGSVTAIEGTVGFNNSLSLTNGLVEFAISGPTNFGQITVSGTANLAGGIGALLLNGYVPAIGAQFNVMTFGSESGAFTDYSGLNAGGGIVFNPTVTATTVTLQAAATNFFGVPPYIVTQPAGQTVNYSGTAMFNAVVSDSPPLPFQWYQNDVPVAGSTNATLTLTNVQLSQAGTYTVSITNRWRRGQPAGHSHRAPGRARAGLDQSCCHPLRHRPSGPIN